MISRLGYCVAGTSHGTYRRLVAMIGIALFLYATLNIQAKAALPSECTSSGEMREEGGLLHAQGTVRITIPVKNNNTDLTIRAKAGKNPSGIALFLKDANNRPLVPKDVDGKQFLSSWKDSSLIIRSQDMKVNKDTFPDAYLDLPWQRGRFCIRPNVQYYKDDRIQTFLKEWDQYPAASEHLFTLELRRTPSFIQFWFDGSFVQEFTLDRDLSSLELSLAPGAALAEIRLEKSPSSAALSLPVEYLSRPGAMIQAKVDLTPEVSLPEGLRVETSADAANIDVGNLGRFDQQRYDDLQSLAWRRGTTDALPDACIASVPMETYSHAYILCASESNPKKVPAFTVRLTRYAGSRGDALADTFVRVPATTAEGNDNARQVGTVTYGPASDRKTTSLWLMRVPLKNGQIQDLLYRDRLKNGAMGTYRYLDFEVLDPLENVEEAQAFPRPLHQIAREFVPKDGPVSSVHIFGMALQKSPASLFVTSNTGHQIFYASDNPAWKIAVKGRNAADYEVQWEAADIEGKKVASGREKVSLSDGLLEKTISVPVTVGNGWYSARFRLLDSAGLELVDTQRTFTLLPPDTRQAGTESPYGTWWFSWAHGGETKIEPTGPLFLRAGLRHTNVGDELPESVTSAYKVSAWVVGWRNFRNPQWMRNADTPIYNKTMAGFKGLMKGKTPTIEESVAAYEEYIRGHLKHHPSINKMLMFWESGSMGEPYPSELWGERPPKLDEKNQLAWQDRMAYVTAVAKMVREKFPQMKMYFGNDGDSLALVAGLLRQKLPREYIDAISVEDLGQTLIPERSLPGGAQSAWFLRETARKLGYGDLPVSACIEWIGRRSPTLGLRTQAEWIVRDSLTAHGYGFTTIPQASLFDAGDGYYHTVWGADALCYRYPEMEPKPSYTAVATLTRVLDRAVFQRYVPTGSYTLYAQEYRQGDRWIYVLWTPRGTREATLQFTGASMLSVIDMYGREETKPSAAVLPVVASTSAQYIVSQSKLTGVTAGRSAFPEDTPPADAFVVNPLQSMESCKIIRDKYLESVTKLGKMPQFLEGDFEMRQVTDPEMGPCLELELKPTDDLLWQWRYVRLNLVNPKIPAKIYQYGGVWIKGAGNWGEVKFLINNAKGNNGAICQDNTTQMYPGHTAINFDGWNFVRYPVAKAQQWGPGMTVTGVILAVQQKTIYGSEVVPLQSPVKLRIKGVSLY